MIIPLGNRILIEQATAEVAKSDGGILLGQERAPQSIKANVLAVGPECSVVKAGDVILVSQFSPTEAREKVSDKTLIACEDDVLAIVTPDKASK